MSVSVCEHTQRLIQRRLSTCFFTVLLSKEGILEIGLLLLLTWGLCPCNFRGWVALVQARLSTVTVWSCSEARFVVGSRHKSWWVNSFWSNLGCSSQPREKIWWATRRVHVRLWFVSTGVRSCRWVEHFRMCVLLLSIWECFWYVLRQQVVDPETNRRTFHQFVWPWSGGARWVLSELICCRSAQWVLMCLLLTETVEPSQRN